MSDVEAPPPGNVPGPIEKQVPVNIEDEMRASYLDYAMSVIIGRALPDVRDGLKPVHRRVLFAMQDLGNTYNRAYKKSARVVGDVIGKYHPHGDQSVYDALVRMAQSFSLRHLLVDGQGNFGSIDGDHAAAMRYTEVRMTRLASEMLADIDKDTVNFAPNYDESLREPVVMPARFPNLLVNGSSGIAVGMATNIPPHNLGEVVAATLALIDDPSLDTEALMQHVPGPDFPTGGIIYGTSGLRQAYETGRGVIHVRGRAAIEEGRRGERIVITEIPYQVNKTTLIEKIADLTRERRIEGISDIRDESDRDGMRIVIELKRDTHGEVVLNQLYSNTALQTSFGFNMLAIVSGQPRVLALKTILLHFLDHRRDVVTRRSRFELSEAQKRFNIVFGLLAAIDAIDRMISIIRGAPDQARAKALLIAEPLPMSADFRATCEGLLTFRFPQGTKALAGDTLHLNETQAQAILDMRLARLTGLERDKLADEAHALRQTIERLSAILASESQLMAVISDELRAILATYADPRRTELVRDAKQMSVEDLIADEAMVVTVSHMGYVKRSPVGLYQAQNRGGRGRTAATTREEDFVDNMFVASTHAYVLIFTDRGKVFWLKVHKIPMASRTSRGKPIVNFIRTEPGERIAAVLPVKTFGHGQFIVMCTAKGTIKKTDLMAFSHPRPSGLIALTIEADDALTHVGLTDGGKDILLATRQGLAVRFNESQVRAMGRTARGVRAIGFKHEDDKVVGMVIVDDDLPELLTVCDNGYGKRTALSEYRRQARGGSGTINIKVNPRNGQVAGVAGVRAQDEVMVVTHRGMMIRFMVSQVSLIARGGQGVRVMALTGGESVAQVARIIDSPQANAEAAQALEDGLVDGDIPGDDEMGSDDLGEDLDDDGVSDDDIDDADDTDDDA